MRGVALGVFAALAALAASGFADATSTPRPILAQPVGAPTAQDPASQPTATLSSSRAGARAVGVALTFETAYVCGRPRAVVITLPAGETVPARLAQGTVKVNGNAAPAVTVHGRSVTVSAPPGGGVMCDSIRRGPEVVAFTARAGLGNPKTPGRYSIGIRHGTALVSAAITIT
jgi:hypothetical protein